MFGQLNMLQREVRCLEDGSGAGIVEIFRYYFITALFCSRNQKIWPELRSRSTVGYFSFPVMSLEGTFSLLNSRSAPIGSLSSVCLDWDACPSCRDLLSHISNCQILWFYCCFFGIVVCVCDWAFFFFVSLKWHLLESVVGVRGSRLLKRTQKYDLKWVNRHIIFL